MITILKCHRVNDPGSEYIRWIDMELLPIDAGKYEDVIKPAKYKEGRRQIFRSLVSDRKMEFVLDEDSNFKDTEDFIIDVYEFALKDVADMLGTTKGYLQERMREYDHRRRMI